MTRWPLAPLLALVLPAACARERPLRPDPVHEPAGVAATASPVSPVSAVVPVVPAASPVGTVAAKPPKPTRAYQTLCSPGAAKKGPPKSIRDVDWCNSPAAITTLKDGKAEYREYEELGGPHDTYIFHLGHVAYGDLDGDGNEDAVVVVDEVGHSAKGAYYAKATVRVWRWVKGVAVPSPGVTAYGVVEATIAANTVEVRADKPTETCVERYVWKSGGLDPVGTQVCKAL